MQTHTNTYKYN